MSNSPSIPEHEVFTCWKEIAAYLRRGVRTVQRWEAQFGLPVRRPLDRNKGFVIASRQELDEWMAQTWSHRGEELLVARERSESGNGAHYTQAAELRTSNRKLLSELELSLKRLRAECQQLQTNLRQSTDPSASNAGNARARTTT